MLWRHRHIPNEIPSQYRDIKINLKRTSSFPHSKRFQSTTTSDSIISNFKLIFPSTGPVQIWETFITLNPNSIMCVFISAALMHRGVGWPPGLTNFAVRLWGLWKIPKITSDPPQAPLSHLSIKGEGELGHGCVRAPATAWNHQSLCTYRHAHTHMHTHTRTHTHTHSHPHTGSLFI